MRAPIRTFDAADLALLVRLLPPGAASAGHGRASFAMVEFYDAARADDGAYPWGRLLGRVSAAFLLARDGYGVRDVYGGLVLDAERTVDGATMQSVTAWVEDAVEGWLAAA